LHNADSHESPVNLETATLAVPDVNHRSDSPLVKHLPKFLRDRISAHHNLQAVIGNSGWLFSDRILRMGMGLIVGVWVARYLGPGRFGLLNYAGAFTSLFGAIAALGLDAIVIRELVKFPEKRDVILGSAFVLRLVAALITFVIVIVAIFIMRRGETLTIWVVALSAAGFIFQSLNVIDLFFQSKVQSKYTVYATNGAFILMAFVKVGLLLAAAPLIAFAWAALGEIAFASLFLLVAYRARHMSLWAWRFSLSVMRDLLQDSWPLIFSGVSIMISMRVDQVLIGQMLSDIQVGIYSAATRIAEIWYFIPWGIASSVFPLLVEIKKHSEDLYHQRLQKYYDFLAALSIVFSLIITFFAGPIIRLLYGPAYIGSVGVLRILIWSGVPMSIGAPWTHWMLLENRTKTMFHFQLFGAALNLILNLLLIPRFGIVGSAYATLISYGAWAIVLCPIMKSQRKAFVMMTKAIFLVWLFKRHPRTEEAESDR
jgi:PST family polysaccharide transporter